MTTITIPELPDEIHIKELTSKDGNGVLDVMLSSVKTLLHTEFKENRLRGTDYSNAFVQLIPHVLQQAGSYSLAKAKLPYEIELLKKELLKADVDIAASEKQQLLVDAQIKDILKGVEIKSYQLNDQMPIETVNLTKQGSQLDAQTNMVKAQHEQVSAETSRTNYEVTNVLPKQLQQTDAQIAQVTKQTDLLAYELTNIKPKELAQLQAQTEVANKEVAIKQTQVDIAKYELEHKLPVELERITAETIKTVSDINNVIKQGKVLDANRCQINAQTAVLTAELNQKLPKELENMAAEIQIKQAQVAISAKDLAIKEQQVAIAAKELALKDEELKLADYSFRYKAPVDVAKTQAEADYNKYKARSEQAETDPSVVLPGSHMDLVNNLTKEQSRQYLRSAQQQLLNVMVDTWKVRYNADPDTVANDVSDINKLADPYVGKVVNFSARELGITL